MHKLYWDSCVLIYRLQQIEPWKEKIAHALTRVPNPQLVVSELVRLECRVKPLRDGDTAMLSKFDHFFAATAAERVPLSRSVFELATDLRAKHGVKTPDALHLAAAIRSECSAFWTNDHRLNNAAQGRIDVVSVDDLP